MLLLFGISTAEQFVDEKCQKYNPGVFVVRGLGNVARNGQLHNNHSNVLGLVNREIDSLEGLVVVVSLCRNDFLPIRVGYIDDPVDYKAREPG